MDWMRVVLSRCAALFRRRKLDEELDEELKAHIELAVEENLRRGMGMEEARTAALRAFGGVTQTKEAYRAERGWPLMGQVGRDLRFGFRQLRRSPGFAMTAILTLALGLGANTAIFSLIDALLLRPLPVPRPEELALVFVSRGSAPHSGLSMPLFRALEKRHDIFEHSAAFDARPMQVRGSSGNLEVPGGMVSGEFFQVLETTPLLGRYLTPMDDREGGGAGGFGAVISEGFWRTWFNSAPNVVGTKLTIADTPFTVVGVMPKSFVWAEPTERADIYVPTWAEPIIDAPSSNLANGYRTVWLRVIARRNPGVSLGQANAALRAVSNPVLDDAIPDANWIADARKDHFQFTAEPGAGGLSLLRWNFERPLIVIFSMCGAMLLLACLNLASLLMARATARGRELATRLALGASRRRLIQQLMAESLLIALLGTAAGLAAAPVVSRSLAALLAGTNRYAMIDTSLDLRVFLFVAGMAVAATVMIGLIPAIRATGSNLNDQIKNGSHTMPARERFRLLPGVLMGLEVALALILAVGAGLLTASLARLYGTGLGFDPKGLVNIHFDMGKQSLDDDALARWYRAFGDALQHLPGVSSVTFEGQTPLTGSTWSDDGVHSSFSHGNQTVYENLIAPDYFRTLRIPILAGRDFQWEDNSTAEPKIVLSQSAARKLFPGQNAVGQRVTGHHGKSYRVIAVVGDIHYTSIREAAAVAAYLPISQVVWHKASYTAVVRLDGPAVPLAVAARSLVGRMAPGVPAPVMTTMSNVLDASIRSDRMMAMLSVFFAVCALLVTAIGLYGTLAYATARRTSEIGIRMALGAQRAQVVGMVLRENVWIAYGGSLAGLAVAWLASRTLASLLYGTSVHDPWVWLGSVVVLILVASIASLLPALRAASIDPMRALRTE